MSNQILTVTEQELIEIIKGIEETTPNTFVGIKMKTDYTDVLKKSKQDGTINPYYKGIKKITSKTYRLVTDYQKRVHNNLVKEGKNPEEFQVESPKGKKHITKSILTDTETETKKYLMVEWFPEINGTTTFEFEGNEIDKQLFEKWISVSESSNQKQGLDREVKPITPNISNILELSVGGTQYIIQH